jgi:hypothetical protein
MGSVLAIREPAPHWPHGFFAAETHFAREYREHHDGLLPDTPFWRYLEHRESIDPPRFAHWHPRVAPWIVEDRELRSHTAAPPGNGGQEIGPPPIGVGGSAPEPGTWIMLACGVAWALWRGRAR